MRQAAQLLLTYGSRVLLCRHARGAFAGRYTGVFAHALPGEPPRDAALRGAAALGLVLQPRALQLRAVFVFAEADDGDDGPCEEHQFVAAANDEHLRALHPTADLEPAWWEQSGLPFERMPADDALWYGRVLSGELLRGSFRFDGRVMLSADIRAVNSLP